MDAIRCQICDNKLKSEEELDKLANNLRFRPSESYRICSNECQEKALIINGCFGLRSKLRNMSNIPFELFNEKMGFPIEGGYAENKYNQFRTNPLGFLHGLDEANFIKFILIKE